MTPSYYGVGEINGHFPRAALGSLGELHYLVATNGKTPDCDNMLRLTTMADLMIGFGCDKAYNLDGYHLNDDGYHNWMKILRYYAQFESEGGTLS